ncbi:hypothetical protein RJ640_005012 [Escallonia rubra]|uniref:RING-type E3 ubiquitin transferase n=1 Tax=Escallonia rubra TaxID=112253 RepID=A0AA88QLS4_9ASTE|nr:hypothetical protein RJ640_005012 [Escallonia rubra]
MAVEARHLSLFPPQLLGSREVMNAIEGNGNLYGQPVGYGMPPLSGTTTETLLPMYGSDSVPAKTAMKSDSGLTYALPVSRKRPRDQSAINPFVSFPITAHQNPNHQNRTGPFTFLGEDISLQIQQQQLEIDRFIAQHVSIQSLLHIFSYRFHRTVDVLLNSCDFSGVQTDKVRLEIEERRKRNSRRIIAAVEDGMMKRLRAREEEIEKIGRLNWALEERVKSLCVENQIWRDLAQTNEATANALRSNLEHVLAAQVQEENHRFHAGDEAAAAAALMDDAESCCGSNYNAGGVDNEEQPGRGGERKAEVGGNGVNDDGSSSGYKSNCNSNRWCRNCGKEESCVLLLPCRHLCLCTVCGSSLHTCPVCKSIKTASVHVNLSSS